MVHLVFVPTPIGNLADITLRALDTLRACDAIAAEDTRHSGILLKHYDISKPLIRLDQHTIANRGLSALEKYPYLAYITDAGTPGISDPGTELIQMALQMGGKVEVLPGPTALIPALVLSGFPTQPFCFDGFLPRTGRERKERLHAMSERMCSTVFYESPHRLVDTLRELITHAGPERSVSITRELSKRFEETFRGSLFQATEYFSDGTKGELVVVLSPGQPIESEAADFESLARELLNQGLAPREIRTQLMVHGLKKNAAYALIEQLKTPISESLTDS